MTTPANIQTQTTPTAPTAPVPTNAHLFAPQAFHYTFFRALKSELYKLTVSVGFWITSIIAVVVAAGIGAIMALGDEVVVTTFLPEMVTGGWSSYSLFLIPLAVLAVSAEYSHNTMRTTVLSVPSRPIAFVSKMTAVLIYCGILSAAIILSETASIFIFGDISEVQEGSVRALVICWLVMTTLSLGAAGLAYLARSTALGIVLMIFILYFLNILLIIPIDDLHDFLTKYLPMNVGDAAMRTTEPSFITIAPLTLSWGGAIGVWLGYMSVLIAGGFARFMKSDV